MSHIVEARTSLSHPDLALLRQAVEVVAAQHQGSVQEAYEDFYGKKQKVASKLALYTKELHRGIGLVIKHNGELVFKGDPYGVRDLYAQVQQEIVQTYVSLATMQALQAMGYSVQAEEGTNGQVVLQGVSYA